MAWPIYWIPTQIDAMRIVYIVTVPLTALVLMKGHLRYMRECGHDVVLISSPGKELDEVARRDGIRTIGIPMERDVNLFADLISLWRLILCLHSIKPHIVNASTPKAGFLGIIAAAVCAVPVRVYWLRGLRLETLKGLKRHVSHLTERIACGLSTSFVSVSQSLARASVESGIAQASKIHVICNGSSNGVQATRWLEAAAQQDKIAVLRESLKIPADAKVIGFVGRLTRDKGVAELLLAYERVLQQQPNTWLLILGGYEKGDPVSQQSVEIIKAQPRIVHVGFVPDPAPYYPLMHVLAFPSYREGFPNVILEAAIAGAPAVGFDSTGVVDAIVNNVTGCLVKQGDVHAFSEALLRVIQDENLRAALSESGKKRAINDFKPEQIWRAWNDLYMKEYTVRSLQPIS